MVLRPPGRAELLVVEDDPQLQFILRDNLEFEGYEVTAVSSSDEAVENLKHHNFSLVLLDIMLPGMNGFELCRQIRDLHLQLPIIMLTARTEEADRVRGLDVGADDYVAKPFSIRELLARVRAQLRRRDWASGEQGETTFGDVTVDLRRRIVKKGDQPLGLSSREFELLRYFLAHRGEVVSREQLLRDVWGYHHVVLTRTVDNFIAKLRVQLESNPHEPRHFITVHGSGYQFLD